MQGDAMKPPQSLTALLSALAIAWTPLVHAQEENSSALRNQAFIIRSGDEGIVEGPDGPAVQTSAARIQEWIEQEGLVFPIPGFQAGDDLTHGYFLAHFDRTGGGWTGAQVSADGVLNDPYPHVQNAQGEVSVNPNWYVFSVDHETGERRYSIDLVDFPLRGFLMSLASSLKPMRGDPEYRPGQRSGNSQPLVSHDDRYETLIVPTLQGENLSLSELLTGLRIASGCDVLRNGRQLVVDWCG